MREPLKGICRRTLSGLMSMIALAVLLSGCSQKDGNEDAPPPSKDVNVAEQINILKTGELEAKQDAAIALSNAGPFAAEAVPVLIEALKSEDADLRRLAAHALGQIGEKAASAVPALKELMQDPDRTVITQAVNSLRNIDPKAVQGVEIQNVTGAE